MASKVYFTDLRAPIGTSQLTKLQRLIRAAGLGVAMGNAPDRIKAEADYVTADCDHDGVAEVIEKYLLG